ncbi:MAG TPA: prepilin-type N-terminal cleavage/methylation domain-containing protein [Lachnospiraceae bacterium]|nr:prepilin-type N-terminal cleavage/methylation domain-containing protein [Lachnospiraceae bacterium]
MKDHRGFSLVELLVAMAVGTIISAGIVSLIVISMRMYHNETVDANMQYEVQSALNQVTDAAMESQGLVISYDSAAETTDYVVLGTFKELADGSYSFTGSVFVPDLTNETVYMMRVKSTALTGSSPQAIASSAVSTIQNASDKEKYLLSESVTKFYVGVASTGENKPLDATVSPPVYENPIALTIALAFEMDGTNKTIHKQVQDQVAIRNYVTSDIYVNGTAYELK